MRMGLWTSTRLEGLHLSTGLSYESRAESAPPRAAAKNCYTWQYVVDAEDGAVSGRVVDLKGRARFGQAATAPAGGPAMKHDCRKLGKQALACALVLGIWFLLIPAGLTREAWHLFAVFAAAIFSVIVNAFPLLTAKAFAVGTVG